MTCIKMHQTIRIQTLNILIMKQASLLPVFLVAILTFRSEAQTPPPTAGQMDAAEQYSAGLGGQTFLVLYQGKIIRESYTNGGNANKLQLLGSATKGFTGMIGAIAAYDGIIDLDSPVVEVLTEWAGDTAKSKITYRHLLTMSSGLEELKDQKAWTDFLQAKVLYPAGSTFIYGPDPNIFGLALQRKLGEEKVVDYMNKRLFQPLGIQVVWNGNFSDGNPQLSGGAFVRANEWYRFGEFVRLTLEDQWTGPDIVPKLQLLEVIQGSPAYPAYGFYWWLKEPVSDSVADQVDLLNSELHTSQIEPILEEDAIPDDFMMCRGAYGQCLYVIPSRELVVVRNGPASPTGFYRDKEFLVRLLGESTSSAQEVAVTTPMRVYPNPTRGILHIQGSDGASLHYLLLDIQGSLVASGVSSGNIPFSPHLPAGLYHLLLRDEDGNASNHQIVIENP